MFRAQILVWLLSIYALLGIVFAPFFVTLGAGRIDPSVKQSSSGFRLMIVPGVIALWPLLALRWARGVQHPPIERNAHRQAAQEKRP
jgi:hypothetical protein